MSGLDLAAATWLLPAVVFLPLAGALLLVVLPAGLADRIAAAAGTLVCAGVLAMAVGAAMAARDAGYSEIVLRVDEPWVPALGLRFSFGVDGLSVPLVLLTAVLLLCCCLALLRRPPAGGRPRALVALLLLLATGMLGTFVVLDLLLFFIFFEVVLIPMWFVIARWGDEHDPVGRQRAANVFILFTLVGSGVMLVGLLLVRARTGTFDMVALAEAGGRGMSSSIQILAAVAIVAGLAVKAPMWPLHTWLPDAHAKAPTVGSVLLAGVLLKMGTYGLLRVAVPVVPDGMRALAPWLAAFAVVGIIYGSLACLRQVDLKRLIAYSSVGHMGFVLLGVASLSPAGLNGAMYANIAHGVITGLLFFLAGAIKDRVGTAEFAAVGRGWYRRAPRMGGLLAFGAVASLGLPGLAGFWGEFLAIAGAFRPMHRLDRPTFLTFAVVAAVGTVLAALYLLAMLRRVCQGPDEQGGRVRDVGLLEGLVWSPLVALTVLLGVWPGLLLAMTDPVAATLLLAQR